MTRRAVLILLSTMCVASVANGAWLKNICRGRGERVKKQSKAASFAAQCLVGMTSIVAVPVVAGISSGVGMHMTNLYREKLGKDEDWTHAVVVGSALGAVSVNYGCKLMEYITKKSFPVFSKVLKNSRGIFAVQAAVVGPSVAPFIAMGLAGMK